jgi:hypothetical protein
VGVGGEEEEEEKEERCLHGLRYVPSYGGAALESLLVLVLVLVLVNDRLAVGSRQYPNKCVLHVQHGQTPCRRSSR